MTQATRPAIAAGCAVGVLALLAGCGVGTVADGGTGSPTAPETSAAASDAFVPGDGDRSGLVDLGDGRELYLQCSGSGSPTVVLVSGAGVAADDWEYVGDPTSTTCRTPSTGSPVPRRTAVTDVSDRPRMISRSSPSSASSTTCCVNGTWFPISGIRCRRRRSCCSSGPISRASRSVVGVGESSEGRSVTPGV